MDRKKFYEKAEMRVFRVDPLDVITTSDGKELVDLDPNAAEKEIGLKWKW